VDSTIAHDLQTPWLVDISRRPDLAVRLRDYFLRLGVSARLVAPALVELTGPEDEATLQEYTDSWVQVHGVATPLRQTKASTPAPAGAIGASRPRLGEVLRCKGLITDEQLDAGLKESRRTGELLGLVLLRTSVIFEDELARTLSEQLNIPYVSIGSVGVDTGAARVLPQDVGLQLAAIPVRFKGNAVQVAFADPTDSAAIDGVRAYVPQMRLAVAELSAIRMAWQDVETRAGRASHGVRATMAPR
jgi:MshEN domain